MSVELHHRLEGPEGLPVLVLSNSLGTTLDLRSRIASIRAPTLVIVADDDPATPPAQGRAIAESIAGARLVTVQPARHLANVEQPETVTRLLLEHLARGR